MSGAHTSAESTFAVWNRVWSMDIMPATIGTVQRTGPKNRPKNRGKTIAAKEEARTRHGAAILVERPFMNDAAAQPPAKKIGNNVTGHRTDDGADDHGERLNNSSADKAANGDHDRGRGNEHSDDGKRFTKGDGALQLARPTPGDRK